MLHQIHTRAGWRRRARKTLISDTARTSTTSTSGRRFAWTLKGGPRFANWTEDLHAFYCGVLNVNLDGYAYYKLC